MSAEPARAAQSGPSGLPRLFAGVTRPGTPLSLQAHLAQHGPVPWRGSTRRGHPGPLVATVEASGLRGRGGAGFPTARKLTAVAAGSGRPVVIANGAEGEPASSKDRVLLTSVPHLVLDGAQLAAEAVGADRITVYVHRGAGGALAAVERALAERTGSGRGIDRVKVDVVAAPDRFVAGEESAATSRVEGGLAKPRFTPPRVFEKGVRGRPTLVQNVETLAHLALLARHGEGWFRRLGTLAEPGSTLLTVTGAVAQPGVIEIALGTTIGDVLEACGGASADLSAVLVGGYYGAFLPAADALDCPLTHGDLRARGGVLGAGVVIAIPTEICGIREAARAVRYLAGENAGQCGPCFNGLPAIAGAMDQLARGRADRAVGQRLERWAGMVEGRGACHHPNGAVAFARSAMRTFAPELQLHAQGRCSARLHTALLPVPPAQLEQEWG